MTKKEIEETIQQLKQEMAIFQKIAKALSINDTDIEKQINLYLDTLNKLKDLLKKTTD
ncbi:MAG: hypothetical protein QM802_11160 [Agriterribacter sp.]